MHNRSASQDMPPPDTRRSQESAPSSNPAKYLKYLRGRVEPNFADDYLSMNSPATDNSRPPKYPPKA